MKSPHPTNESHPGKLERRTVLKGAAWSLPVIAAATAVPLASATGPGTCPTADRANTVNSGSGNFTTVSGGQNGWMANSPAGGPVTTSPVVDPENPVLDPRTWQFMRDGALPNGGWNYLTTTLAVTAGTSYTFVTPLRTGRGNTAETWRSEVSLTVDGAQLWYGTTKEEFVAPDYPIGSAPEDRLYGRFTPTGTYEANETKVITVVITLHARAGDHRSVDDIWVTLPTITCAQTGQPI